MGATESPLSGMNIMGTRRVAEVLFWMLAVSVPLAPAGAQTCGALTNCTAISGVGLVFFGRDNYTSAFASGNFLGSNSAAAFSSFKTEVGSLGGESRLGVQTFDASAQNNLAITGSQP